MAPKKNYNEENRYADILVVHKPAKKMSNWWRALQIISFAVCTLGGFITCITMGRINNGFGGECVLYSEISFRRLVDLENVHPDDVRVNKWGSGSDCEVCEYVPVASAAFAFIFGALFLQCSNIGELQSRTNISWMVVIPSIPVTLTFFICSCVILAYVVGGLTYFCDYVLANSSVSVNLTSCSQVYGLDYPYEPAFALPNYKAHKNLYVNFILVQFGASLNFIGWFFALGILILRCCCFADFQVGTMVPRNRRPVFAEPFETVISYPVIYDYDSDYEEETPFDGSENNSSTDNESKALL